MKKYHLSKKEIPLSIYRWSSHCHGKAMNKFILEICPLEHAIVQIGPPVSEYNYDHWQAFSLQEETWKPLGEALGHSGYSENWINSHPKHNEFLLTMERVIVQCSSGYHPYNIIYALEGVFKIALQEELELTPAQMGAIQAAYALKSFARPRFKDEIIQSLVEMGLMAKNRSLTLKGKNWQNSHYQLIRDTLKAIRAEKSWAGRCGI